MEKEIINQKAKRNSTNLVSTSRILGKIKNLNNKNKVKNKIKENANNHNPPIKKNTKRKSKIIKSNFKLNINDDVDTSIKRIKKSNIKQ